MVALELELTKEGHTWQRREQDLHCQGLSLKEFQRLSQEDSTLCLLTSRLTVTLDVVRVGQREYKQPEHRDALEIREERRDE